MLVEDFQYTLYGLYACILHEIGHLLCMQIFHMEVTQVVLYGAGIKIKMDKSRFYPIFQELIMLSGGCMINFFTFILFGFLENHPEIQMFGVINLTIGAFNLLPLRHFDGGKILHLLIDKFGSVKNNARNHKLLQAIGIILIIIFMILLTYCKISNFTLFFTLSYFIIAERFLQNS